MNKYIDAEKLIAEIERRKNESRELPQEHKNSSLKTSTTPSPVAMLNDNTITLCSLAEPDLTRYTIENAIG